MQATRDDLEARLAFLRDAERLKDTLRSAFTSTARVESAAEHSWRLSLLAMTFADHLPEVDLTRVMKLCIVHDLGEAISGDVPAPAQDSSAPKAAEEREDFLKLVATLPANVRAEFVALWDEYDRGESQEARAVKALDKIETILQHNQGRNPEDFDYAFNLHYGRKQTDAFPLTSKVRELLDRDTERRRREAAERGV